MRTTHCLECRLVRHGQVRLRRRRDWARLGEDRLAVSPSNEANRCVWSRHSQRTAHSGHRTHLTPPQVLALLFRRGDEVFRRARRSCSARTHAQPRTAARGSIARARRSPHTTQLPAHPLTPHSHPTQSRGRRRSAQAVDVSLSALHFHSPGFARVRACRPRPA